MIAIVSGGEGCEIRDGHWMRENWREYEACLLKHGGVVFSAECEQVLYKEEKNRFFTGLFLLHALIFVVSFQDK